ncbi:hypothetical protein [Dongshaea marina]|uniref:hypothetical protein n=1 Tax=Dongshaea marina TaxID=2047966 RepID=UPI000D3EB6DA|nr:hypothetical protein [Dongshaea marina]
MPQKPVTPEQYQEAGISWFEYYAEDKKPVSGSQVLKNLESINQGAELSKKVIDIGVPLELDPSSKGVVSNGNF